MERLLKRYEAGLEEVDTLEDVVLSDQASRPAPPASGRVKVYSSGHGLFRLNSEGAEAPIGGPTLWAKQAFVSRLCPAFWNDAGSPIYGEGRICPCIWKTPEYLYLIGGTDDNWTVQDTVIRASWDDLSTWELVGRLPGARTMSSVLLGGDGNLWLFGGFDETWTQSHTVMRTIGGDFRRWEIVVGASAPVVVTEAISYGSKRYLISGYDENLLRSEIWVADEADLTSWQVAAYMPMARYGHVVIVLDGRLYVIGGGDENGVQRSIYSAPMDNLSNWTSHQDSLYRAVYNTSPLILGDRLYLFGGIAEDFNPCSVIQSVGLKNITGQWQVETDTTEYDYGRVDFVVDTGKMRLWRIGGEIYSSAFNMLWTPISIAREAIGETAACPAVEAVPSSVAVFAYEEEVAVDATNVTKLRFGQNKGIEIGGSGALVVVDEDRREESEIATQEMIDAAAFYGYGGLP
ncbi:MAG: hypothetical protein AB1457_16345 [Chloroflexota bacterium]